MYIQHRQKGFSLVELSIVILIMGLLLGGLMLPLSMQRENARLRDAIDQTNKVSTAIEGFALVDGFLPCPAIPASGGIASPTIGGCTTQHGFVPATTLAINGPRNNDNLLLDPWGSPLRYSVSSNDADADGTWDFVSVGEMRDVTMPLLQPDLVVCSTATGATAATCAAPNVTLTGQASVVIYSLGKDWSTFTSADQLENVGANLGGGPSGATYPVAGNAVFVSRGKSDLGGSEYDDVVIWLSPNRLFSRLVDAGHLP